MPGEHCVGDPYHLVVFGKSSIDYTLERVIGGEKFLQSSRQGPLSWLAAAMILISARHCLSLSCMLS